jgi:hypothetical protein
MVLLEQHLEKAEEVDDAEREVVEEAEEAELVEA